MQFKLWVENLARDYVRRIVLDAAGGGKIPNTQTEILLGSKLAEQPKIVEELKKYTELQPYIELISKYVATNPNANLVQLIDFIYRATGNNLP